MLKLEQVKIKQKDFIEMQLAQAKIFIEEIIEPNDQISTCMLSGSVARGDYWVGPKGGAIDLIIFVANLENFDTEKNLGKNIEPDIPGHFIQYKDTYYQVKIYDETYFQDFDKYNEPEKYAIFESRILFNKKGNIEETINKIKHDIAQKEIKSKKKSNLKYARYLINGYKVDRWKRRGAIVQLNQNLSKSIELCIKCLFYINGKYCPAEDRALYYSCSLPIKPNDYDHVIDEITLIKTHDLDEYLNRERNFNENFLAFFDTQLSK